MSGVSELARQDEDFIPAVILINGPPGSGKDTVGRVIQCHSRQPVQIFKFANVLKNRTHALYGLDSNQIQADNFETSKDTPSVIFHGLTPRQAYIEVSERYIKPLHGQEFFGNILAEEIADLGDSDVTAVVPDSGFVEEAQVLIDRFGADQIMLIRLHRDGYDFSLDSRSYITLNGVRTFDVQNPTGDIEGLIRNLQDVLPRSMQLQMLNNRFDVEILLPVAESDDGLWTFFLYRHTLGGALAAIESSRRGAYSNNTFRVSSAGVLLRYIMPGDPAVAEIGVPV